MQRLGSYIWGNKFVNIETADYHSLAHERKQYGPNVIAMSVIDLGAAVDTPMVLRALVPASNE